MPTCLITLFLALWQAAGAGQGKAENGRLPPKAAIVFGGDSGFPPYEYLDKQGQPAGLNVDLIRAVAKVQGLQVSFRLAPWSQVRTGVVNGRIDVATMYRSSQRARELDFAIPHELIFHEMFVRRGAPPLQSLAELAGKRVLVEADAYAAEILHELGFSNELHQVVNEPAALQALARGEGDVAVVTQSAGRPFQWRLGLGTAVVATGPPILLSEYAFVARKGHRDLIEALNEGVAKLKASGEYDRIYNRWIRPDRSAAVARRIAWALGVAVVAVLLVVLWNQSLRRRVAEQTEALRREFAERERTQAALVAAERSLRQSQKLEAVGRLAGGIAHDFNNILTVILSYARMLRDDLSSRGMETVEADEILAASERAMRLTKQMLVFSRATPVKTERLDLCAEVRQMKTMLQRLLGEHIQVETVTPASPVVIEADVSQIEQTLINLAANARDAMPRGGRFLVEVSAQSLPAANAAALPAGDYASLKVSDTGVGMDAITLSRVFEPFFTTKEVGKGTGLGLATVFANAQKLGGRITAASEPGCGATFTLLVPQCPATPATDARVPDEIVPRGAGETILLVEDDEALQRAARIALERAGYRVVEAKDGEEAVEIAAEDSRFALLVTDVVMPRRSGPQLVSELRQRIPSLRVLYVSGYVSESASLDLSPPGTAFLAKPYTGPELLRAIHGLLH